MTTAPDPTTPATPAPTLPLRETRSDDGRLNLYRGDRIVGWTQRGYAGTNWEAHWRNGDNHHQILTAANADAAAVLLREMTGA